MAVDSNLHLDHAGQCALAQHDIVQHRRAPHLLTMPRDAGPKHQPLFDGEGYIASAVAVVPTQLVFVPKEAVLDLCRRHPAVALSMLEAMAKLPVCDS